MRILKLFLLIFLLVNVSYSKEDVLRPRGSLSEDSDFKRYITIGLEAGLNYNIFNQNMTWNPNYLHGTIFDPLTSASGISPHIGAMIDIPLDNTFGIQLKLAYDMKNFGQSSSGYDYDIFARQHDMKLDVDVTSAYFTVTPLLRINATDKLFFNIGPTFHSIIGPIETTWKPEVADGTALNNFGYFNYLGFGSASRGSVTLSTNDVGSIEKPNSPRIGLEGGIGYKFDIAERIYLVPQLRVQLMMTPITNNTLLVESITNNTILETTDRMLHSIQLALAVWFEL
ncbi:MAG: PorT family protein [Candidatus Kapabacteria bacterium]|nr:PorT family protein [Candidatus Kapabacteria bacterium]